jgi:hypothetical protein
LWLKRNEWLREGKGGYGEGRVAKERWVAKGREGWLNKNGWLRGGKMAKERWLATGREGWLKRDGWLREEKGG